MKVKELIERLSRLDADAEVHIAYGAGDYWRTTLAPAVRRVEMGDVEHSDYHRGFKLIADDETADEKSTTVVVIR
jgi:hypothetical protein